MIRFIPLPRLDTVSAIPIPFLVARDHASVIRRRRR
jgi:hypothetical protein